MRSVPKLLLSLFLFLSFLFVSTRLVSAHQPKITNSFPVIVTNPEISKAFYSQTTTTPQIYDISSNKKFELYVNILTPDIPGQSKDLFVTVIQKGSKNKQIAYLDGSKFTWTKFFEPFGHDDYLKGPEFKTNLPAGDYEIIVTSKTEGSKYSLAIGETETFGFSDSLKTVSIIPRLKTNFFSKSPIDFLLSPIGTGYIIAVIFLSFIFGFIFRVIMLRFSTGKVRARTMNIGSNDRLFRFLLGIVLLLTAVLTSWNFILIFIGGFSVFESIFSWCGVYALMGKNTCPI